jgi:hypothetical protein
MELLHIPWLPVVLMGLMGLMGGCSSGAHFTASRPPAPSPSTTVSRPPAPGPPAFTLSPPEPNPPIYLAQVTCWDTISCCVQRNPLTAVQSCGADPVKVASILKTFESLYATAHPGTKEAAEADVAGVEQTEDWASIADLPEWKQRCNKFWYACKENGWTGSCTDCLRYCEGQHEWPTSRCGPRMKKK